MAVEGFQTEKKTRRERWNAGLTGDFRFTSGSGFVPRYRWTDSQLRGKETWADSVGINYHGELARGRCPMYLLFSDRSVPPFLFFFFFYFLFCVEPSA